MVFFVSLLVNRLFLSWQLPFRALSPATIVGCFTSIPEEEKKNNKKKAN